MRIAARSGASDDHNVTHPPRLEWMRPIQSCLTSKDYTLLEGHLLEHKVVDENALLLARLIRTKLSDARIVLSDDIAPDVATGNSRIAFSVDGGPERQRMLVHWEHQYAAPFGMPIFSLLGATLLGMRAGERAALLRSDGTVGYVELRQVEFQPEAARRSITRAPLHDPDPGPAAA